MTEGKTDAIVLTEEQRRLVAENIGLVAVHLRRNISNLSVPRRDREWEDLFQEGCLGLIRAAVAYRAERGIPFVAFAFPRIRNAVSRALQRRFSTVYIPPKRSDTHTARPVPGGDYPVPGGDYPVPGGDYPVPGGDSPTEPSRGQAYKRPQVHSLSDNFQLDLADKHRHDPSGCGGETIGDRLRSKYERAVDSAGSMISSKASTRGDREKLVRILVEHRFLIPHEESRRALRQIARDTRSSYARVAQCDKQLGGEIRNTLEADPEFLELKRRGKSDPDGTNTLIDKRLERDLAESSADAYARRFRVADPQSRTRMLDAIIALASQDIDKVIRTSVLRLPMRQRERLLQEARGGGEFRMANSE